MRDHARWAKRLASTLFAGRRQTEFRPRLVNALVIGEGRSQRIDDVHHVAMPSGKVAKDGKGGRDDGI